MRLIVITPNKNVPDELPAIIRMFESGLKTLHIRKPKFSTSEMEEYITLIPEYFHNHLVIHSHHKLAVRYNLKGIHLGRAHLSRKWRYWLVRTGLRLKFSKVLKSRSYTRLPQTYQKEDHDFDYYLLGTVFNIMNGELYSGFYDDGIIAANRNCGKRLVARGGTTVSSIGKALALGFYGIAFNSFIWNSDRPAEQFQKILDEFKTHDLPPE